MKYENLFRTIVKFHCKNSFSFELSIFLEYKLPDDKLNYQLISIKISYHSIQKAHAVEYEFLICFVIS